MTDTSEQFTRQDRIELLMALWGYSAEDAADIVDTSPADEVFDVVIDGKPYIGRSIFDTE